MESKVSSKKKDWKVFEFYVPIEESFNEGNDFVIRGVAINETITLNNVKYVAEELQKAAMSFRNVPILLDHRNEIGSIVGRTTENVIFNPTNRRIEYEGKIMDEKIKEMIKDGRIQNVSIGAKVNDLVEEEDGSMKAIGIRGLEISLVAVPGDSKATLGQALHNSFKLKEKYEASNSKKQKGGLTMTEQEQKTEQPVEAKEEQQPVEAEKTEAVEEPAKEKAKEEAVEEPAKEDASEMADLKKQVSELKELLTTKKKLQEQVAQEKEEEAVDETKGEVATETEESLNKINSLILERAHAGYSMYRDYTQEDAEGTQLKRLVR